MARFWIAGVLFAWMMIAAGAQDKKTPPAESATGGATVGEKITEPATYVSSIGEAIKEYAVQGHYAYLAQDHTFRVVDIADKQHPKSVGTLRMDDMIWSVAVYKNAAYCGMLYDGFSIIDITDPRQPRLKSYHDNGGRRPFTGVEEGVLWVSSGADNHWITYSLADPFNPKELKGGKIQRDDGKETAIPGSDTSPFLPGIFPEFKGVNGVAVSGKYAFLADGPGGLRVIDVSNPAEPQLAASLALPGGASNLMAAGHFLYVTSGKDSFHIIDISSPCQPKQIGACELPGETRGIAIHDLTAYIICDEKGLQIIDLTRPAQPIIRGEFPGNYWDILIEGKTAYVSEGEFIDSVVALDLSKPFVPLEIGRYKHESLRARYLAQSGKHLFAVGEFEDSCFLIDSSQPKAMKGIPWEYQADELAEGAMYQGFCISGKIACRGWGTSGAGRTGGLDLIDIGDPLKPRRLGTVENINPPGQIAMAGGYIYLAQQSGGLLILKQNKK